MPGFGAGTLPSALAAKSTPGSPEAMGYQALLGGLSPALPAPVPYAVYSIDWYHPTADEQFPSQVQAIHAEARQAPPSVAAERRRAAEVACREVLKGTRRLKRFEVILGFAQRYALLREEQVRDFTLGWPLLRRCAAELGARLHDRGIIAAPEDVYFLTLDALQDDAPPQQAIVDRAPHGMAPAAETCGTARAGENAAAAGQCLRSHGRRCPQHQEPSGGCSGRAPGQSGPGTGPGAGGGQARRTSPSSCPARSWWPRPRHRHGPRFSRKPPPW